jgi:hypothetical protein
MKIFTAIAGGNRNVVPILLVLILSALVARAVATNEIRVGALPAGGTIYTNATITRVTPAYVVVSCQEGMVQIPMSNMPAVYQAQFGYTPETAAQYLNEEKKMQKKRRAAVLAQQAAQQARSGTNRPVRITTTDDNPTFGGFSFCSVDVVKGGVLVENLPDSVRQFMADYRQLQADIADCEQQVNRFKATGPPAKPAPKPQMGKNGAIRDNVTGIYYLLPAPKPIDPVADWQNAKQKAEDRLKTLNVRLAQATTNYNLYTTIIAHPSGQSYVGKPIWVCVGVPPAAAAK